jgi:hypothetical protein
MKALRILVPIAMLAMFIWVGLGCSNPDTAVNPDLPNPGDDYNEGDQPQFPPPTPYYHESMSSIHDFAFEKDGELAISDDNAGIFLFDTFGEFRRMLNGQTTWDGLIDVGPGVGDWGRGIIATGSPIACFWASHYDDQYVSGGTSFGTPEQWWMEGEADPR